MAINGPTSTLGSLVLLPPSPQRSDLQKYRLPVRLHWSDEDVEVPIGRRCFVVGSATVIWPGIRCPVLVFEGGSLWR